MHGAAGPPDVRRLILQLFRRFRRNAIEQDLAREIAAHLAILEDEYQRRGMTPGDARRLARINLGGIEQTKERHREARALGWLDDGWRDLRHSARLMAREPLFASAVVVILAIGIGLNLAFFQVLNVTVLRPQAVANPDTLVRFDRIAKRFRSNGIPYPATQFIREHNDVLASVLTWSGAADDVVWGDDTTDRVPAAYVSANWFSELGYGAARGRVFLEAIDARGRATSHRRERLLLAYSAAERASRRTSRARQQSPCHDRRRRAFGLPRASPRRSASLAPDPSNGSLQPRHAVQGRLGKLQHAPLRPVAPRYSTCSRARCAATGGT
jgi:hypothetical protein